ncbi:3D (Asp-Asp-Asp) domain-containing protein [Marivirga sericea]|uniref:3D (Asp-Asp-Asp) domain-containing protein n=1 Tax=Marivirga sericea TaxID=1028 RepID=A0A1X7LG98_9BACT|nr:3D domain-containing protein [Marivirga sericea]SMG52534.1 3D (Asp-Asp-Asp) domain-containing protein [Marivirga sericea]
MQKFTNQVFVTLLSIVMLSSCDSGGESGATSGIQYDTIQVTATAYNSVEAQTKKGNPALAAWGDTLKPGMKAIAISRDFLREDLLEHNSIVKIEGLEGSYVVMDKMNKRWTRKIDIYMGLDEQAARNWGKQQVELYIPIKTDPQPEEQVK